MITKLLIANRGEIARRIIRSAHDMGIATVAIYADPDAGAPFVEEAGEAFALGGSSATETYLDVSKVLDVARRSGADAVHPGYGFLSENAGFARAVLDAGLRWVGPPPAAMSAMGDKLAAKRLADDVGVPTLPSGDVGDAERIGFPVLLKAAAGGGGKGMRVVHAPGELEEAAAAARREAQAAFGDERVFLERWLTNPRHVEIQILGDAHGNLVHLGERECSIQRRHQKVIEEAPSPAVSPELRARMGEAALTLAGAMGYESAGTVEFLLDGDDFWFLEVNTRLQVEHPVTEAVTGLDLVREQLRVADGDPLAFSQADVVLRGHAVEARLYAEDPAADFLPATGTVTAWAEARTPPVRYDSGIEAGSVVGTNFDPMLAKVIAYAPTREEAALRLALALERTVIGGLVTNRDFLVATLRHPAFLAGDTTTDFIARHQPSRRFEPTRPALRMAAVAAALTRQAANRAAAKVLTGLPSGWRNSAMPPQEVRFRADAGEGPASGGGDGQLEDTLAVRYRHRRDGSFEIELVDPSGDDVGEARLHSVDGSAVDLELDGRRLRLDVRQQGSRWLVQGPDGTVELTDLPRFPARVVEGPAGGLHAPMPGKVLATRVSAGDRVSAGQLLVILEAMKMAHRITAPEDGTVAELRVSEGDQVDNGALLLVLEAR
jgi:propionyl-CoA carboxylase alpha chain